jgi:hypothetical protein
VPVKPVSLSERTVTHSNRGGIPMTFEILYALVIDGSPTNCNSKQSGVNRMSSESGALQMTDKIAIGTH